MSLKLQRLEQQKLEYESQLDDLEGNNDELRKLFLDEMNDDKGEMSEERKMRLQKLGLRKRTVLKVNRRKT